MLPFVRGQILSVITRFEPNERLEEDFEGAGSKSIWLISSAEDGGIRLIQRETMVA